MKPFGIDLSLAKVIDVALQRFAGLSKQQADSVAKDETIDVIKKREEKKWNQRKSK